MALRLFDPFNYEPLWTPMRTADRLIDSFFDEDMQLRLRDNAGLMKVETNGDFSYKVNVLGYKPDELKVDIEGENLVIQGEHKQEKEGEFVHRQFLRKVRLPKEAEKESIHCDVENNGLLTVTGKHQVALEDKKKRHIPIEMKKTEQKSITKK